MAGNLSDEQLQAIAGSHYADDPNFYCSGRWCIDNGCNPLHCAKHPENDWDFDDGDDL